jgi:signal transduction histidine kinase
MPTRRLILYWLLTLLPALAIGGLALRYVAQETELATAQRKAALADHGRRAAEDVLLLVENLRNGVILTLESLPYDSREASLRRLENLDPLVRTVFLHELDTGRTPLPTVRPGGDERSAEFLRRYAALLEGRVPWFPGEAPSRRLPTTFPPEVAAPPLATPALTRPAAAPELETLDVQLEGEQMASAIPPPPAPGAKTVDLAQSGKQALFRQVWDYSLVGRDGPAEVQKKLGERGSLFHEVAGKDAAPAPAAAEAAKPGSARRAADPLPARSAFRSGWRPWHWENDFHLLGFVLDPRRNEVFGVEVELLALLSRLPTVLEGGATAALLLRDIHGNRLFQSRWVGEQETPAEVFNLGPALPFFELAVFPADPRTDARLDRTRLLAVSLLVGVFLAAIASGGGLLAMQARASAREALQKTSFVANVSHELKTPLTTLRLYTELLREGQADEAKRKRYLDVMLAEGERLSRLVGNVLDFSRLEQGGKRYQMRSLDLAATIAPVLERARLTLAQAGRELRFLQEGATPKVRADADAVEQILLNLLDNAAKYGGESGAVEVVVRATPAGGRLSVLDRGPGVPAGQRERVFEKFHRLDDALTARQGGCGLGLSIARRLARDQGGDLTCAERPGGGAAFHLDLPPAGDPS